MKAYAKQQDDTMLREKEDVIRKAMIVFDAFIMTLAFYLAYLLRKNIHIFNELDFISFARIIRGSSASISDYLVVLFFVVPFWCGVLYFNGMYRSMRTSKFFEVVWIILKSSFFAFLVFGFVVFLLKLAFVSRMFFILFVMLSSVFLLLEKIAIFSVTHYMRKRGHNNRRLLVVGTGKRAAHFINKVQNHPEWGIEILGLIDDEPGRMFEKVKDVEIIGELKDLPQILHRYAIDEVVFIVPRSRLNYMENAIYDCEIEGIKATIAVDLFDLKIARAYTTEIGGIPLVRFETTIAKEWQLFIKRTVDIFISGLAIIILSPLFFILAILIRLSSPGPVLFKQKRLGLSGRKFVLYKFRTMYMGAEKELSKVDVFNEIDKPDFKNKKIQYITPIGRILRKFSIDEFPQLLNVIAGHMSFVGPRPTPPREVVQYQPWQRRRLSMRPGLSCLWQISGRNKIDYNEWMKMDLKYLDNWSLWLDFKIMIKTIPVVLFGVGAY